MVEAGHNGVVTRVVLLARAGKAADNLVEAVRQAGAELLAVVDPAQTDVASLRAHEPQAILVALEPSIESALDDLDALLIDPNLTVIFDEADVAAHRSGWDAARWVRHLSAKLRRDGNVLPPGTESDNDDWQPSPGKVPQPAAAYANVDISVFTQEAVARADSVPFDGMPHELITTAGDASTLSLDAALLDAIPSATAATVPPPLPKTVETSAPSIESLDAAALELAALDFANEAAESPATPTRPEAAPDIAPGQPSIEHLSLEPLSLEPLSLDEVPELSSTPDLVSIEAFDTSVPDTSTTFSGIGAMSLEPMGQIDPTATDALDAASFEHMNLDAVSVETVAPGNENAAIAPMQFDDDAFFLETLSASGATAHTDEHAAPIRFDTDFEFDLPKDDAVAESGFTTPREPEAVMSFEDIIAQSVAAKEPAPALAPEPPRAGPPPLPPVAPAPASVPEAVAKPTFSFDALSLAPVDDDTPAPVNEVAKSGKTIQSDLSMLEARISSLSLVDIEEAAPAQPAGMFGTQATGVVLIEAGLGGPDPARQLLSAIPAEFPAIVLVRLHLQGGRYDRLVAQMERASALPVALAESGASANPGTIYFMPDSLGVAAAGAKLRFVAEEGGAAAILSALPANNSAMVFLSGSDPKLVDVAMAAAATGTVIAVQTPEDCYDGTACAELRARGVASALPAELAGRLASRWPTI